MKSIRELLSLLRKRKKDDKGKKFFTVENVFFVCEKLATSFIHLKSIQRPSLFEPNSRDKQANVLLVCCGELDFETYRACIVVVIEHR